MYVLKKMLHHDSGTNCHTWQLNVFRSYIPESESNMVAGPTLEEFFQTKTVLVVWRWLNKINFCRKREAHLVRQHRLSACNQTDHVAF